MNEKLLALPRETVTGDVKFTQQEESISENYGNPRIAQRNLEQMGRSLVAPVDQSQEQEGDGRKQRVRRKRGSYDPGGIMYWDELENVGGRV